MADTSCCGAEGNGKISSCCSPGDIHEVGKSLCPDKDGEVCCGGPPPPRSDPFERAGYALCPYVRAFKTTGQNTVPLVATGLSPKDKWGGFLVRLGINRENYKVSPGLYGVGNPGADSPVIVTANYKLTFDVVRSELQEVDAWLLVLDTCGINVWCAAGKKTFSTAEIVNRVQLTGLEGVVSHRRLIVPQLGATGVCAQDVKRLSGFSVVYGPVRAADLQEFLKNGKADAAMRRVSFTLHERLVLIPVEFTLFGRKIWWTLPILMLLSGIGPRIFSLSRVWERGLVAVTAVALGVVSGTMLVPIALPWLPGRAFALKGAVAGIGMGILAGVFLAGGGIAEMISLVCCVAAIASYLAMNFTGSTPFTSPSGVEREMKRAIPVQAVTIVCALVLWLAAPFIG